MMGTKTGQKKKEGKKGEGRSKARQVWERKFGKWLFVFLLVGQNWPRVSAAAEGQQKKDGGSDEGAAGGAGQRMQMGGGDFTKVEETKRGRQN